MIDLNAFVDEFRKISGPRSITDPSLSMMGMTAVYVPPGSPSAKNVSALPSLSDVDRRGAIVSIPKEYAPPGVHRMLRRHELIHHIRNQRGKMEGVGSPGLRNVLRTAREELMAYTGQLKRAPDDLTKRISKQIPQLVALSTMGAYPHGLRKAMIGGTLGKVLPEAAKDAFTHPASGKIIRAIIQSSLR